MRGHECHTEAWAQRSISELGRAAVQESVVWELVWQHSSPHPAPMGWAVGTSPPACTHHPHPHVSAVGRDEVHRMRQGHGTEGQCFPDWCTQYNTGVLGLGLEPHACCPVGQLGYDTRWIHILSLDTCMLMGYVLAIQDLSYNSTT